jgi:16S rRNA G1207 methylase RsmC
METLRVFQLKDILRQYLEANPEPVFRYKTKSKTELLILMKDLKIDPNQYDIIPIPVRGSANILKKYLTAPYTEAEQQKFIEEEPTTGSALVARKEYMTREGKYERLTLQEHQIKFIKQFVYSNLQGAIVFHGVGSGKTLTAVVSAYWYLQLYPTHKVLVISPSALLFNFIEGMKQYGIQIEDNRYSFTTYDKYSRNPKSAKDTLLIVDEAHNCRTEMDIQSVRNPMTNVIVGTTSSKNKRGFNILQYGAMTSHKILLLTGTAFVNNIYDVENLLAMIDQRMPITAKTFSTVLGSISNIETYFSYRISYYPSPKSEYFPERREKLVPLYMSRKMESAYNQIVSKGNRFLFGEKMASNLVSDGKINPKIKWIIDKVLGNKQKFIIYTGLYKDGIQQMEKQLIANKIKYVKITGKESAQNKELSKKLYNGYDYGNPEFFGPTTPEFKKHINSDFRVLLISRAGAEGVDTINTQNLIIIDHQWNDALSEQIIARAIRYKSHFGLPVADRFVNVYRLFLCFERDRKLVEKIQSTGIDYIKLNTEMKDEMRIQLKIRNTASKTFNPTVEELRKLKDSNNKPFIPEKSEFAKLQRRYNKPDFFISPEIVDEGWDQYAMLGSEAALKQWRIKMYARWEARHGNDNADRNSVGNPAIDLRLYILCQSKSANIQQFISYLGKNIKVFEQYESELLKIVIKKEKESKRKLTDEEQASIYASLLKNEKASLKQLLLENSSISRGTKETLQQYFTNDKLAEELINMSDIMEVKTTIEILEPTAGDGSLVKPLTKLLKVDYNIDLVEIDEDNRIKLNELMRAAPNIIRLSEHRNFLTFIPSKRYDYIFMNPPFHLRKDSNAILKRDTFDYDFVQRAYAMLKVGGTLLAITGKHWMNVTEAKDWYDSVDAEIIEKKNEKFDKIKINVSIIKIIKTDDSDDNRILDLEFYKFYDSKIGEEIMNAELSLKDLKPSVTETTPVVDVPIKRKSRR